MTIVSSSLNPLIGDRCTVECELRGAGHLWLIVHKSLKNMTALQTIKYDTARNQIDYGSEKWRSQEEFHQVVKNPARVSFAITFTVRETDRTKIQCISTNPSFEQDFLELNVQRPPAVIDLYTAHPNGTKKLSFVPDDIVLIVCNLMLGTPKTGEENFAFTAPGEPMGVMKLGPELLDEYGYANRSLELRRRVRVEDNEQLVSCSAANDHGPAERTMRMNIIFPVRNVRLSAKHNGNVTAGELITCQAEGNPPPFLTIAVLNAGRQQWARDGATGYNEAKLKIPENANLSRYSVTCTASNVANGKPSRLTTQASVYIVGPTLGNIGLYAGVVAAIVLLIVIIAVIVVVRKRSSGEAKPERRQITHPVLMFESGRGPQSYGTRVDTGHTDDRRNGGGVGSGPGDSDAEEGVGETTKLHYATLDLEDTPRSRLPIVFDDDRRDARNYKVEYSEIVPSLSNAITTAFDDDHLYENVRHHDV